MAGTDYLPDLRVPEYRQRAPVLLAALLLFILVFPVIEQYHAADLLLVLMLTCILVSAILNAGNHPGEVAVTLLLVIPAALTTWLQFFIPSPGLFVLHIITIILFLTCILSIILRRIMQKRVITSNEIFGAVSVYIMIGIVFAYCYQLINQIVPGSIALPGTGSSLSPLLFLSFQTLCTVGFGDIAINTPLVRSVAILEMIAGVMYIAIFVGVLVNAHYRLRERG